MIAAVIRSGKTCVALWTSTKINKNYLFGENQSTLLHRNPPFFTDFPSSIENYRVESKQKYKKQPLADASASHLSRSVASTKGQKPLVFGEKPNPVGTWYFTSAHNRDTILNINHLTRTRSIASLPCKIVFGRFDATSFQEFILSSGVFRRETASGFCPWGNVDSPRKRVGVGLCGWRHENSFPMTQNAQSHSQMRSIPHCPKAVFYVFVFESIHDTVTLYMPR